ncbi:hypothetical protein [Streptomyces sp. NPDC053728]|uniref:hypothetical protein n=1 Tax=Streptomyces sp. NPDC053728 TaxID=3155534 RepID=UPI003414C78A
MAESANGTARPRGRRTLMVVAYLVVILLSGVVSGAVLHTGGNPVPLVVGLLVLLGGLGAAAGVSVNRALARETGVPRGSLRSLTRRVQREDIPDDPQERAAMGRIVARQRRATERLVRFRWAYLVLATFFVLGALQQFLEGRILPGGLMLVAAAAQCCTPLLTRRSSAKLDRVEAELRRREPPTGS